MISKINVNSFRPAFGVVTKAAQKQARKLAGNDEEKIDQLNTLFKESAKYAPNVKIKYNDESADFYFTVKFPNRTIMHCRKNNFEGFKSICDKAKHVQEGIDFIKYQRAEAKRAKKEMKK